MQTKLRVHRRLEVVAGPIACLVLAPVLMGQAPQHVPPEKTAAVYGQTIHYYEQGEGPNLILLHGLGGSGTNWIFNIGPMSQKYHVYALDQIGFGNSDKPFLEYRIATFVDFLHEFMNVLGISKASLVGNSLGGWIAVDFAARYPDMVDKLVLVDAAGLSPQGNEHLAIDLNPASLEGMRTLLQYIVYDKQSMPEPVIRQAWERHVKSGDGYTIQQVMAAFMSGREFEDERVGKIHNPTLLLWGRDDKLTRLSLAERFQKMIPGAKLVAIEQCGHLPELEKPAEFNAELSKFLAQP